MVEIMENVGPILQLIVTGILLVGCMVAFCAFLTLVILIYALDAPGIIARAIAGVHQQEREVSRKILRAAEKILKDS